MSHCALFPQHCQLSTTQRLSFLRPLPASTSSASKGGESRQLINWGSLDCSIQGGSWESYKKRKVKPPICFAVKGKPLLFCLSPYTANSGSTFNLLNIPISFYLWSHVSQSIEQWICFSHLFHPFCLSEFEKPTLEEQIIFMLFFISNSTEKIFPQCWFTWGKSARPAVISGEFYVVSAFLYAETIPV